jgi:outer membrane cobalamin receptor
MMRRFLTALGLLVVFTGNAAGQNGIIKGKVTDKNTGEPLAGVYIIYGKSLGTTTGQDGNYTFTSSGKLTITYQFIGYEPVTKQVFLTEGVTEVMDISLAMKVKEIDQIVISANRTEQRISELTVSMDIIKSSFLSENHISDAQELINKTPGIEILDGQASIRGGSGFSYGAGSRVMALIDGLPMISADAGSIKWQYLPLENLSQIEIIKGASSVLYGSSALNGVINFRTADATNIPVTQFYTEAGFYGKPENRDYIWWNTPTKFASVSFSHLQKFGRNDIGLSFNVMIDEGYRKLNEEMLERFSFKLKHFNGKVEGLSYGLNVTAGNNVKRDFLVWEDADSGALRQSPTTANEFHGTYLAADPFISLKKSNRYRHDLRMRIQSSLNRMPDSEQNNSDAISVYTEYQLWYRLFDFLDITAGIVENYSKVKSNFFGDHTGLNLAGFTQVEVKPLKRLTAVAGVRLENYFLNDTSDGLVPIIRTGINWQAAKYTFLRASFGQGYRYPSIAEKYAATTMGSIRIIANPDIESESGWSAEIGVKQGLQIGPVTGQADLSVFMLQNSNLIEYKFAQYSEGVGFRAENNPRQARVYGSEFELLLSGVFGRVATELSGGYTFMYPVEYDVYLQENTDTYLKYRRMHSGKISSVTTWKKFSLGVNLNINSKILNIDKVFLDTPILLGFDEYWPEHNTGYTVIDGIFGYKLSENLSLSLAIKNMANTEYMGRPGDIQPQRNVSLRLSGKF